MPPSRSGLRKANGLNVSKDSLPQETPVPALEWEGEHKKKKEN